MHHGPFIYTRIIVHHGPCASLNLLARITYLKTILATSLVLHTSTPIPTNPYPNRYTNMYPYPYPYSSCPSCMPLMMHPVYPSCMPLMMHPVYPSCMPPMMHPVAESSERGLAEAHPHQRWKTSPNEHRHEHASLPFAAPLFYLTDARHAPV